METDLTLAKAPPGAHPQPSRTNGEASVRRNWQDLWQEWRASLSYRPLLLVAAAVVCGCALGAQFSSAHSPTLRTFLPLIPTLALAGANAAIVVAATLSLKWRPPQPRRRRIVLALLFLAIVAGLALYSAHRTLPPPGDISGLVRDIPAPIGPQRPLQVELQGWVADHPQGSEFGTEFPFECDRLVLAGTARAASGYVWVRVPPEVTVEVGNALILRAQLTDLARPGNPGERSSQARYIAQHCWCQARVRKASDVRVIAHATPTRTRYALARWVTAQRRRLNAHYETAFAGTSSIQTAPGQAARRPLPYPHMTAQLLAAMVFGEGGLLEPLPRLTRDQFRAAGLSHILVASGTQVAFLALLLIAAARLLGLRSYWLLLAVLPALLLYALIAGGAASIWRATVAGACVAWALLLGRDIDGLSLWSLALIVLLLIDPAQLHDLGFQLTFAATWGLLALAPALRNILRPLGNGALADLAALSLGAQLAVMPLVLYHFGRFSMAGLGANFLAIPLSGLLVASGVLGLILPPINVLNYWLTRAVAEVAAFASRSPGAQAETLPLPLGTTLLCYALLLLAVAQQTAARQWDWKTVASIARDEIGRWWQRQRTRNGGWRPQSLLVVVTLAITAFVGWRVAVMSTASLRVTILDVGQGESIVIRAPSGRTVLIDGGTRQAQGRSEAGRSVIVPYLQSLGVNKIDALVVTHADSDHCNALPFVLRELPVGLVIDGAASAATPSDIAAKSSTPSGQETLDADYQNARAAWRERGIPTYAARPGQRLHLGDGIVMTVIAPLDPPLPGDNNNSAVLRLDYGAVGMLFTGDIEAAAEERLVRRGMPLRCTVLKLAHHGSKTSTTPLLLRAAQPQIAVLSCGRYNSFGHPAPQILHRLNQRRVPVYRTDVHGAVEIFSDGRACWVQTMR